MMNKAFEKIFDRLDDGVSIPKMNGMERRVGKSQTQGFGIGVLFAKEIVKEVSKEYKGGWIACSERLPKEKLCEDGKYDPSEKVLIQLDNEEMFTSRYWSHRHSKDSDDFEKWIDLPDYYQDRVLAWQPLPEPYEEHW